MSQTAIGTDTWRRVLSENPLVYRRFRDQLEAETIDEVAQAFADNPISDIFVEACMQVVSQNLLSDDGEVRNLVEEQLESPQKRRFYRYPEIGTALLDDAENAERLLKVWTALDRLGKLENWDSDYKHFPRRDLE